MRLKQIAAGYILLFACSCQQEKTSISEAAKITIAEDVRQTLNDYVTAIKRDGLMAEFDYLDTSVDFFWVPPGYENPISYDSVAVVLNTNAPRFKSIENSFDTLRIIPLTEALATYTAKLHSIMVDTSGTISTLKLIETGVVIKRKNGWKLLNGQTSLINEKE